MDYLLLACALLFSQVVSTSVTVVKGEGTGGEREHPDDLPPFTSDRVLTVTTILIIPYASLRLYNQSTPINVNHLYEGYIVDLMDLISQAVGFKYRLIPVFDGTFGYKKPDGTWDGMIGELTRREADIAAGPMYITAEREKTVEFTRPFMDIHASMVMRRPEHGGPTDIRTLTELLQNPFYSYGTLNRGIIRKSLRTTNSSLYQILYEKMISAEEYAFTRTNEEGIERVRTDDYVYILPDKIADYVTRHKPCDLTSIGSFLIDEHFGLAVPKGSVLLSYLNRAIDLLQRRGELERLYKKWWHLNDECHTQQSSKILSLRNVYSNADATFPANSAPRLGTNAEVMSRPGILLILLIVYASQT